MPSLSFTFSFLEFFFLFWLQNFSSCAGFSFLNLITELFLLCGFLILYSCSFTPWSMFSLCLHLYVMNNKCVYTLRVYSPWVYLNFSSLLWLLKFSPVQFYGFTPWNMYSLCLHLYSMNNKCVDTLGVYSPWVYLNLSFLLWLLKFPPVRFYGFTPWSMFSLCLHLYQCGW